MNKKIIFCDIDGTLINHRGVMPASAKEAICKARKNGHLVFLCTGRSKATVVGDAAELEVDGEICSAGGYIEVENEVIRQEFMAEEVVEHIVKFFNAHNVHFCLEAPDKIYVSPHIRKLFKQITEKNIAERPEDKEKLEADMQDLMSHMADADDSAGKNIYKVLFFGASMSNEELQEEFKGEVVVLPNSMQFTGTSNGELMLPDVHKASGIEYVLEHLGLNKKDTVGYGDSLNDLEMLQFVNLGIAMGNACEALKEAADEQTDSVDEDGIYKSFKKCGFIS